MDFSQNSSDNNGGVVLPLSRQTSTSSIMERTNDSTTAAAVAGNDDNGAITTNTNESNAPPRPSSSSTTERTESRNEASLLLGIAENIIGIPGVDENGNPKREPGGGDLSTLPASMTSFLDMLTEDQRRKRHRHIPAVEGFRRLYKNEIKGDVAAARVLHSKRREFDPDAVEEKDDPMEEEGGGETEGGGNDDAMMNEVGGGEENDDGKEATTAASSDKDAVPDKLAFIAPSEDAMALANCGRLASLMVNTPFENSFNGGGAGATSKNGSVPRSPQLVDSLTAFNPPRPKESSAAKTRHRMKRWEANPSEIEFDLSNWRKTVQKTRNELQAVENERGRVELVSSVLRDQFQKHLIAYKEEVMAVNDQLLETNMGCLKAEETYNVGRSMSLRGSGKSMKDALTTLKALEEELKNASAKSGGGGSTDGATVYAKKSLDWRVPGVGGVSTPGSKAELASGWILDGDNVITPSGEAGKVTEVKVVAKKDVTSEKSTSTSDKKQGQDAMDVDKPKEGDKNESVDKSIKVDDGKKSADDFALTQQISVHLSNGDVKKFTSSQLKFNPIKPPKLTHPNKALGKRWRAMLKTAEAGNLSHDLSAMEKYINASFGTDDGEEGNDDAPPPTTTDGDNLVAPFGSDMLAAPESIRDFPSVIPPDTLEETVRKVVYETTTPRIIPEIPSDLKKYEAQKEDLNRYQAKVMQLRHRLGRQKRLRGLNERSLAEGKSRSLRVENLLLEMQMDLKNLKERLHGELSELGISNTVLWNGADENGGATSGDAVPETNGATVPAAAAASAEPVVAAEVGMINNVEAALEPESKRVRVE